MTCRRATSPTRLGKGERSHELDAAALDPPVEDAATQVADELQLAPGWLNNQMQGFLPPGGIDDSREFIERGGVITLGSEIRGRPERSADAVANR